MAELRELAQHSSELNTMDVRLVPISVDDQQHAHEVWEKVADKKFTILSDPGATVIKRYGLLHESAQWRDGYRTPHNAPDRARRHERWRRISQSIPDIPKREKTLAAIKSSQKREHGMDQEHR